MSTGNTQDPETSIRNVQLQAQPRYVPKNFADTPPKDGGMNTILINTMDYLTQSTKTMERKALHDLQMRDDIIITKADKGGATVIWDVKDYLKEVEKQLNNQTFYKKVETCPTEEHTRLIENTLDEFVHNGDISEAIAEGLKPSNSKTPRFYMLPKIHKNSNPGRPVVSSVKSHTSQISKYVDHHIQPLAKNLRSYVKDTTDFINKIKNVGTVPKGAYLVSMDVCSLYTNIPNDEGHEALRESLDKMKGNRVPPKSLLHL